MCFVLALLIPINMSISNSHLFVNLILHLSHGKVGPETNK